MTDHNYHPYNGEHVRVVLEGTAGLVHPSARVFMLRQGPWCTAVATDGDHVVSVEPIPPSPLKTPGTVIEEEDGKRWTLNYLGNWVCVSHGGFEPRSTIEKSFSIIFDGRGTP